MVEGHDNTQLLPPREGVVALRDWLERVFKAERVGWFVWDVTAGQHSWTEEFRALYGLEPGKIEAHPDIWLGYVHPVDRSGLEADVLRAVETGEAFEREFRIIRADGAIRWMHAACVLERDEVGILRRLVGANTDITERRHVEDALEDCVWQFQRGPASELIGAYVFDYAPCIIRLSPYLADILGLENESASSATLLGNLHPMDAGRVLDALARASDPTGDGRVFAEGRVGLPSGQERWIALSGRVFFDDKSEGVAIPARQVGLVFDLSQHKYMQQRLAASEATQRAILDTGPDAIIVINDRGVIQSMNAVAVRQFGYTLAESIGHNVSMLMTSVHAGTHDSYIARYLETGVARIIGASREVEARRSDGTVFPAELHIGEIHEDGARAFVGFVRDCSRRIRAEEKLRAAHADLFHAARLSEMGEIVAEIAHELNQPLTAAANFLNAARRYFEHSGGTDDARDALSHAAAEQLRAGQILQRMRSFLTKGEQQRRCEPLNAFLKEAVGWAMLSLASKGVTVEYDLGDDVGDVLIERVQLQQVVLNLVRNSVEAMRANAAEKARILRVTSQSAGSNFAKVIIEDSGSGIDPAFAPRLFDAFATTKGDGMGVGLRICKSIIEGHGGVLTGGNGVSGGACFEFTVPLA